MKTLFNPLGIAICFSFFACSSVPSGKVQRHTFPKGQAFVDEPKKGYLSLGFVRSKVNFQSLDPIHEEDDLCRNYYNQSVRELLEYSKKKGGDAVAKVRSVVFYADGSHKLFPTPECSDDGMEGQILTQGEVIQWKDKNPLSAWSP